MAFGKIGRAAKKFAKNYKTVKTKTLNKAMKTRGNWSKDAEMAKSVTLGRKGRLAYDVGVGSALTGGVGYALGRRKRKKPGSKSFKKGK